MKRSLGFLLLLITTSAVAAVPIIELPAKSRLRFIVTGDAGATHSRLRAGLLLTVTFFDEKGKRIGGPFTALKE